MLCVSITASTPDDIFSYDLSCADCVEVRLDCLKNPLQSLDISWSRLPVPVIATCRSRDRGGRFDGTPADQRRILSAAAHNGAAYVEMDYRDFHLMEGATCIASCEDFDRTPDDVGGLLSRICSTPSQIAKLATTVQSWADNRRLLDLLSRAWPKPVIVVGMGHTGEVTRIIGPSRGSFLTYAEPDQITAREIVETYHFRNIRRTTKLIGVLGKDVRHSRSPIIHNRAFNAMHLDFVYVRFPAADVRDFFENARAIGIKGCSITIPHKVSALPYLDEVSRDAQAVGAVNTVSDRDGKFHGDNTDVHGVRAALASAHLRPEGRRAVILGAGGAARAAAAALRKAERVVVLSRSSKVQSGWPENVAFDALSNIGRYPSDLLINATPVGMSPAADASLIDGRIPADIVFDMVYTPAKTRLLANAEAQGKTIISGTVMFLAQAQRQFEIWTGCSDASHLFTAEQLA